MLRTNQVLSREIQMTTRSFFVTCKQVSKTVKPVNQLNKKKYKRAGFSFSTKQPKLEDNARLNKFRVLVLRQVQSSQLQVNTRSFFVTCEQVSKTIKQVRELKKKRYTNVGWNFFQQSNWYLKAYWKYLEFWVEGRNQVQSRDLKMTSRENLCYFRRS